MVIILSLFMLYFGFVQCPWARVFKVCHEQLITIVIVKRA